MNLTDIYNNTVRTHKLAYQHTLFIQFMDLRCPIVKEKRLKPMPVVGNKVYTINSGKKPIGKCIDIDSLTVSTEKGFYRLDDCSSEPYTKEDIDAYMEERERVTAISAENQRKAIIAWENATKNFNFVVE